MTPGNNSLCRKEVNKFNQQFPDPPVRCWLRFNSRNEKDEAREIHYSLEGERPEEGGESNRYTRRQRTLDISRCREGHRYAGGGQESGKRGRSLLEFSHTSARVGEELDHGPLAAADLQFSQPAPSTLPSRTGNQRVEGRQFVETGRRRHKEAIKTLC